MTLLFLALLAGGGAFVILTLFTSSSSALGDLGISSKPDKLLTTLDFALRSFSPPDAMKSTLLRSSEDMEGRADALIAQLRSEIVHPELVPASYSPPKIAPVLSSSATSTSHSADIEAIIPADCQHIVALQHPMKARKIAPVGHVEPIVGGNNYLMEIHFLYLSHQYLLQTGKNYGNKVKQELRVVLHPSEYHAEYPSRDRSKDKRRGQANWYDDSIPQALFDAQEILRGHPLNLYMCTRRSQGHGKPSLEVVLEHMQSRPQCKGVPIFLSMAAVGSDLYWQLIENFVYTAVKFGYFEIVIIIFK
jgi:hypothetical protein